MLRCHWRESQARPALPRWTGVGAAASLSTAAEKVEEVEAIRQCVHQPPRWGHVRPAARCVLCVPNVHPRACVSCGRSEGLLRGERHSVGEASRVVHVM